MNRTEPTEKQPEWSQEEHDRLTLRKKQIEDQSYRLSKKLYMKEFNLALLKGVSIIGIVIVILSITLSFFIDLFIRIGITAGLIAVIFAVWAHFYNRKLKKLRDEKEKVRQTYTECCDSLDSLDSLKGRE